MTLANGNTEEAGENNEGVMLSSRALLRTQQTETEKFVTHNWSSQRRRLQRQVTNNFCPLQRTLYDVQLNYLLEHKEREPKPANNV